MSYTAESVQRARGLGQTAEAVAAWRELLLQTHVDEADYGDWCRSLASLYEASGRGLAAARIYEYLLEIEPALELYRQFGTPRDRGRILRHGGRLREASEQYREAALFAHAARAAEEDEAVDEALSIYEQLARAREATGDKYLTGLAALNGARVAKKKAATEKAATLLAQATRLLEQEADEREQAGNREGAFQCYLSLIQIGREEGSYENLAEGYLNCIRILKAKSDRFGTMQFYYAFISHSQELEEIHSVAELHREAGEYARRVGFIYGDFFLSEAATAWREVARVGLDKGNPTELIENALLAAVGCYNRIHDDNGVAECYEILATLPVNEAKFARYEQLSKELRIEADHAAASREGPLAFPEYFRRPLRLPEIWSRDLLSAESGNDIPDAIGRLVGDQGEVWEVQRRKALLIALAYDDHIARGGDSEHVPPAVVESIGGLQHAAAVRPLAALYDRGGEDIRVVILERGTLMKQKEVFELIDRGLQEDSARIRAAALQAIKRATFPPALESLVRLFNTHSVEDVREACLRAIATIGTDEACEFLLDIVRANPSALGMRARNLLEKHAQERMLGALGRNRKQEPDPALKLFIGRLVDQIRSRRGSLSY